MAAQTTNSILKSSYDIDVVRLIGQYLVNMGLKQTANSLLEESGLRQLEHPIAMKFRDHIMAGDWDKANQLVEDIINLGTLSADNLAQAATNSTTISTNKQNGCGPTMSNETNDVERKRRSNIDAIRLAIAEQKFLELLEENDRIKALRCLRCEVTPLCADVKQVQFLTTLLMCKSSEEIRLRANWSGKNQHTRQLLFDKMSSFIPPPILLPPKRLETLLNQAVQLQRDRCLLHMNRPNNHAAVSRRTVSSSSESIPINRSTGNLSRTNSIATIISELNVLGCNGICSQLEQQQQQQQQLPQQQPCITNGHDSQTMSSSQSELNNSDTNNDYGFAAQEDNHVIDLKTDHVCSANNFPLHTKQVLDSHDNEVWFCKFSNDGRRLATGGLNGKIKIWTVDLETKTLKEKCTLDCPCYAIGCLSWSPDDTYLLACGSEERPHLWIWNMDTEQMQATISHKEEEESTTTCSWHMNGRRFAAASIKGTFNIYDVNGWKRGGREGVRVQCLSFLHKDPNILLAADTLNRIKAYRVDCSAEQNISIHSDEENMLEERYAILSFIVDSDDKYIAVNVREQGINLWDLRRRTLLRIFLGVSQRNIAIFSSFSSPDSTFLASGSEDGRIYIFHKNKDEPVAILNGHRRCVNCVSWNPKYPELIASVSDDHTVRLWAPLDPSHTLPMCLSLSQGGLFRFPGSS